MAIVRLQHIGLAVTDLKTACERFEQLFGLTARDFRNDQGRGMQLDARILLGNDCWLHLVQNWNPESRVYQFHDKFGPGLEHLSIQTDSIEQDVAHLRALGVPIYMDKIFNAPDGFEAFVYPDQTLSVTVELIQPHVTSWAYPTDGGPVSTKLGITQLQHTGMAVNDVQAVCDRFQQLFGLASLKEGDQARISFANDCWVQLKSGASVQDFLQKQGPNLEYVALETNSIQADVNALRAQKISVDVSMPRGENAVRTAKVDRADVAGIAVELVSA